MLPSEQAKASLEEADRKYIKERRKEEDDYHVAKQRKRLLKETPVLHKSVVVGERRSRFALILSGIVLLAGAIVIGGLSEALPASSIVAKATVGISVEGLGVALLTLGAGLALVVGVAVLLAKGVKNDYLMDIADSLPEETGPEVDAVRKSFRIERIVSILLSIVVVGAVLGTGYLHFWTDELVLSWTTVLVFTVGVCAFYYAMGNGLGLRIKKSNGALNEVYGKDEPNDDYAPSVEK